MHLIYQVWDNERVERFIKAYGTPFDPSLNQKRRMRIASKLISGKSVLDIGCGMGHLLPWIKDKIEYYVGVDSSEEMLRKAEEFFQDKSLGITYGFTKGNVYDLSRFDIYDSVVAVSLLIHLPDVEKAIREMWNHAKKEHIFSVQLHNVSRQRRVPYKDGYLIINWHSETEILNYITKLDGVADFEMHHNIGKNWFVKVTRNAE